MKEVWYAFGARGVDVICDEDESVRTIFLRAGVDELLSETSFSLTREEVLALFGSPSKSGAATRHVVLGDSGAWDRFDLETATIHFQYRLDSGGIEMITLMRPDAVP
jgi:phage tail tube protein FII